MFLIYDFNPFVNDYKTGKKMSWEVLDRLKRNDKKTILAL
jgi:hypothetical protein